MARAATIERLPTVVGDQSALQSECRAAWHMTNDGAWVELHSAADIDENWERTANSLAASCYGLDEGARMVTEVGHVTLVASRRHDGVWIGLRDRRGNPITLISALHSIETRVRSRIDLEAVAPRIETEPLKLARPEESEVSAVPRAADVSEPSRASEGPNLADVVSYLNAVTDMTSRYADRNTVCEYWERSLNDSDALAAITFSYEDGFLKPAVNRSLSPNELAALDDAFASWKLRIRLALGTIYSKIPLLKTPAWR